MNPAAFFALLVSLVNVFVNHLNGAKLPTLVSGYIYLCCATVPNLVYLLRLLGDDRSISRTLMGNLLKLILMDYYEVFMRRLSNLGLGLYCNQSDIGETRFENGEVYLLTGSSRGVTCFEYDLPYNFAIDFKVKSNKIPVIHNFLDKEDIFIKSEKELFSCLYLMMKNDPRPLSMTKDCWDVLNDPNSGFKEEFESFRSGSYFIEPRICFYSKTKAHIEFQSENALLELPLKGSRIIDAIMSFAGSHYQISEKRFQIGGLKVYWKSRSKYCVGEEEREYNLPPNLDPFELLLINNILTWWSLNPKKGVQREDIYQNRRANSFILHPLKVQEIFDAVGQGLSFRSIEIVQGVYINESNCWFEEMFHAQLIDYVGDSCAQACKKILMNYFDGSKIANFVGLMMLNSLDYRSTKDSVKKFMSKKSISESYNWKLKRFAVDMNSALRTVGKSGIRNIDKKLPVSIYSQRLVKGLIHVEAPDKIDRSVDSKNFISYIGELMKKGALNEVEVSLKEYLDKMPYVLKMLNAQKNLNWTKPQTPKRDIDGLRVVHNPTTTRIEKIKKFVFEIEKLEGRKIMSQNIVRQCYGSREGEIRMSYLRALTTNPAGKLILVSNAQTIKNNLFKSNKIATFIDSDICLTPANSLNMSMEDIKYNDKLTGNKIMSQTRLWCKSRAFSKQNKNLVYRIDHETASKNKWNSKSLLLKSSSEVFVRNSFQVLEGLMHNSLDDLFSKVYERKELDMNFKLEEKVLKCKIGSNASVSFPNEVKNLKCIEGVMKQEKANPKEEKGKEKGKEKEKEVEAEEKGKREGKEKENREEKEKEKGRKKEEEKEKEKEKEEEKEKKAGIGLQTAGTNEEETNRDSCSKGRKGKEEDKNWVEIIKSNRGMYPKISSSNMNNNELTYDHDLGKFLNKKGKEYKADILSNYELTKDNRIYSKIYLNSIKAAEIANNAEALRVKEENAQMKGFLKKNYKESFWEHF
jgi:hypothetical protein